MNTVDFLKETIEDINPKLALGNNNPTINFLDLTVDEFSKLKAAVFKRYNVLIRMGHMFKCVGLVELAWVIDALPKSKLYCGE